MSSKDDARAVFQLQQSGANSPVIINENSMLAPVVIEELDESVISSMDVDMTEFIEAEALEAHEVPGLIAASGNEPNQSNNFTDVPSDAERQEVLTADEEDRLTKQFLNGELTFSEYSFRMDQSVETEVVDSEVSRKAFENELMASKQFGISKSQKSTNVSQTKSKRRRRILPPALKGLMGEANLRFARGEVDLAVQMCMEIIRQVPSAPEPFYTLAMIYENDQPQKSLQFALIAAHLSPKNADQWIRLANLSLEHDNIKQAITCYSKAIQGNPKDICLYETRAKLQEEIGDKRGILKGYFKLLHHLTSEDGNHIVKCAKMVAKRCMQDSNNDQALEAMEHIFTKCPELVTLEEVNIMIELLIAVKQYRRCLDLLTEYTKIQIHYKASNEQNSADDDAGTKEIKIAKESSPSARVQKTDNKESKTKLEIESCEMPDNVVVDLKAKLLVILIELDQIDVVIKLLPKFYTTEDPEVSGDLFLDIAEALMTKYMFRRALALLERLVKSENYSLAAVWLRHAECWVGCQNVQKAIESYEIVRTLSPRHLAARIELAKLYKYTNQYHRAIEVLKQDPEVDILDPGVMYQRTLLLLEVKDYGEFLRSGMLLLSRHCAILRSKAELHCLIKATGIRQRIDALNLYRLSRGESLEDENSPDFSTNNEPTIREEFLLLLQICKVAFNLKKFGLLQRVCCSALTSRKFEELNSYVIFLSLISCIHNRDSYYGYNLVRELVRVCRRSNAWNLLNVVIQRAEDCRHNRFIMRILGQEDAFSYLHILHANNCLVSGTYKYALNDYVALFKVSPNPLLCLLIGVTFLQMACQKFSAKKNQLVVQALAFFKKYKELRGDGGEQEVNYNMARCYHQLGLLPGAIYHYKLVLESPVPKLIQERSNLLDLRKEAAFNLHLIYVSTENHLLARMYLENYITV
ncbi:general transcription factor 3C polypeptide 3 [Orussus abietinus]|uniref:general transcription factor 3C polypeptide 3 n=1 Tax=Orussus abietinus TaxID=222816 RepID=UPI000625D99C|nr:general transcription factor 3C polypeptide 3 [Orussus abietinus]